MWGIGTDLVEISRVVHWTDDADMLTQVFTTEERKAAMSVKYPHRRLAVFFAVKEAFMKAIGTGWGDGVVWQDIEARIDGRRVYLRLYGRAAELCNGRRVFASACCSEGLALATVVLD